MSIGGWAGAAYGASQALQQVQKDQLEQALAQRKFEMEIAAQQQQQQEQAQLAKYRDDSMQLQRDQLNANQSERTREADLVATDRRDARNKSEVGRMVFEGIRLGTATPKVGRLMLGGEGAISADDALKDPEADAARANTEWERRQGIEHSNRMGQIAAQGRNAQAVASSRATTRAQGRPVLSGDANRIAELRSSVDDLKALRDTIAVPGETGGTGTVAKIGAAVPNAVTEWTGFGMEAKKKQAVIDRVKQVIGKALEGGVLRKEDEAKYARILPTIGDPDGVMLTKLNGLDTAIKQRLDQQIETLSQAGYNVSGFGGPASSGTDADDDTDALLNELLGL